VSAVLRCLSLLALLPLSGCLPRPQGAPFNPQATAASISAQAWQVHGRWAGAEAEEFVAALPERRDLAGWWRFLNNFSSANEVHGADDGLILLDDGTGLLAVDPASGVSRWYVAGERDNGIFLTSGAVISAGDATLVVRARFDGRRLWERHGLRHIAHTSAGIWVQRVVPQTYGSPVPQPGVVLLDMATGAVLHEYEVGTLKADQYDCYWGKYASGEGPRGALAVATDQGLQLLYASGRHLRIGDAPFDFVRLALQADSLLVLHFDDSSRNSEGDAAALSCYKLPSGEVRWTQDSAEQFADASQPLQLSAAYALVPWSGGARVLSAVDGTRVYDSPASPQRIDYSADSPYTENWEGTSKVLLDGDRAYLVERQPSGRKQLQLVDLKSGQSTPVLDGILPGGMRLAAGHLICTVTEGEDNSELVAQSTGLCRFPLNAAGQPQAGQLQLLNSGPDAAELRPRFMTSTDPAADADLRRELEAGGLSMMLRLAEGLTAADGPQWDALAQVTASLGEARRAADEDAPRHYMSHFRGALRRFGEPLPTERVARWLADDRLRHMHIELLTRLAAAGEGEVLRREFQRRLPLRHVQAAPPFELRNLSPLPREPGEPLGMQWLGRRVGTTTYAAITGPWVMQSGGVFIGVDTNGDNRFEELLPTGFSCTVRPGCEMWDVPVTFSVSAEKLTLGMGHSEPRPSESYTLAQLRRDRDGDGLTDILEGLLQTNPRRRDTDRDGLSDFDDAAPNVDAKRMGRAERGVARGLYLYVCNDWQEEFYLPDASRFPYRARFIQVNNCGPVAYSPDPSTYTICNAGPRINSWLFPDSIGIDVDFVDLHQPLMPQARKLVSFYTDPEEPVSAATVQEWVQHQLDDAPPNTDALLLLTGDQYEARIYLRDIDGELYPLRFN
jgi:hypothetical protein